MEREREREREGREEREERGEREERERRERREGEGEREKSRAHSVTRSCGAKMGKRGRHVELQGIYRLRHVTCVVAQSATNQPGLW